MTSFLTMLRVCAASHPPTNSLRGFHPELRSRSERTGIHHNTASHPGAFAESFIQAPALNFSTIHLIPSPPVLKSCAIHWEESAGGFGSDLMLSSARKSFVWISLMSAHGKRGQCPALER